MNLGCGLTGITFTFDPRVLVVRAVVAPPHPRRAILKAYFSSGAGRLAQPDGPVALGSRAAASLGQHGPPTAQLPAHHLGGREVPADFAYGAPLPLMLHLHSPLAAPMTTNQPHALWNCGENKEKVSFPERMQPSQKGGWGQCNISQNYHFCSIFNFSNYFHIQILICSSKKAGRGIA